jgi:hypothetical protein
MSITRRLLLAGIASSGLPAPFVGAGATTSSATALCLYALALPQVSARAVGRAYLARFPEERAPIPLTRLILEGMTGSGAEASRLGKRELQAQIAARLRADFAEGYIAKIDGWLLSRTEGRLCALALCLWHQPRGFQCPSSSGR